MGILRGYGYQRGLVGEDMRAVFNFPGRKSALAMVASFEPEDPDLGYDADTFAARLIILAGVIDTDQQITIYTDLRPYGTVIFEAGLRSPNVQTLFPPLTDLQGNVIVSGQALTVILTVGQTASTTWSSADKPTRQPTGGELFIPMLYVAGQVQQNA